jgi:dolichol-phosphate mannosyltransferase
MSDQSDPQNQSVAVLLPTLNEVASIKQMISKVRTINPDYNIYVVDSGSTDGTVDAVAQTGAKLISLKIKGKGLAIKKAFEEIDEDVAVLLDSDMSYFPEEIPLLIRQLDRSEVVVGSRFKGDIEDGAMSSLNKFGNQRLTDMAKIIYGREISDVCSGFWAFRKDAYKKMNITAPHFSLEANFFSEVSNKGMRLAEVPIRYGKREGETKLNPLHGIDIGLFLIKNRKL